MYKFATYLHQLDQHWHSLLHQRLQSASVGTLKDGAKRHESGVAVAPVGVLDVVLDERKNVGHDAVLAAGGKKHHADPSGLARVPVVLIVKLFLQ